MATEVVPEPLNPLGVDGIEFIEYATSQPQAFGALLQQMGFAAVARHRSREVVLYRQGAMNVIVNSHGAMPASPALAAIALRVRDAGAAYHRSLDLGAWEIEAHAAAMELNIPGIHGVGESLVYFVDRYRDFSIYDVDFVPLAATAHRRPRARTPDLDRPRRHHAQECRARRHPRRLRWPRPEGATARADRPDCHVHPRHCAADGARGRCRGRPPAVARDRPQGGARPAALRRVVTHHIDEAVYLADNVVLLTAPRHSAGQRGDRHARPRSVIGVEFERHRAHLIDRLRAEVAKAFEEQELVEMLDTRIK